MSANTSLATRGGAAALPQIKDMIHDFVVNTNTPITAAEMDDAWFGKIANTTHDLWSASRARLHAVGSAEK